MTSVKKATIIKIAAVSVCGIFLAMMLYLLPQKIDATTVAVPLSENGDQAMDVTLSISKQHHLCKPSHITGSIWFDGTEYRSMSDMGKGYDIYSSNSLAENIKLKYNNFRYDLFVRSDLQGQQMDLLKDTITIEQIDQSEMTICKFDENGTILYSITLP